MGRAGFQPACTGKDACATIKCSSSVKARVGQASSLPALSSWSEAKDIREGGKLFIPALSLKDMIM